MSSLPLVNTACELETPSPLRKREYTTSRDVQDKFMTSSTTIGKRSRSSTPPDICTSQHSPTITHDAFDSLVLAEKAAHLSSCIVDLVPAVDSIVELGSWILATSSKYHLHEHIAFVAANIMKTYLCQPDHIERLKPRFLVSACCLILAHKLDNANSHLKPSRLIRFEKTLESHTVLDFIGQEMKIIHTLRWEFAHLHPPHAFAECFSSNMELHPKIKKTTRRCMKHCLVLHDYVLLMASQVAVYCLMASCLYHHNTFYYKRMCTAYAQYQPDTAHTESMCNKILDLLCSPQMLTT